MTVLLIFGLPVRREVPAAADDPIVTRSERPGPRGRPGHSPPGDLRVGSGSVPEVVRAAGAALSEA
ncbi:hypothetical protein TPA0908_27620 [Micromonospora sp. AKA38]|nr:hypothetical protein TPA0908_27620 [Micromonospora sp. AKA38]